MAVRRGRAPASRRAAIRTSAGVRTPQQQGRNAASPGNENQVFGQSLARNTTCGGLLLVLLGLIRRTPSAKPTYCVLAPMRSDSTEISTVLFSLLMESIPEPSCNADRYLTSPTTEGQSQEALLEGTAHG